MSSGHLKKLTNKMAESKKLIKEFERRALSEGAMDANALAAAKKEYIYLCGQASCTHDMSTLI